MPRSITNIIGFDDVPFARDPRGDVRLIGTNFSRTRADGVLSSKVRRDGANSTRCMIEMIGIFTRNILGLAFPLARIRMWGSPNAMEVAHDTRSESELSARRGPKSFDTR